MIEQPPQNYTPPQLEKKIQGFWEKNEIFKKSVEQKKGEKPYVFLEGPPTANGIPHPGHVLTRIMKDSILRYMTMNGHYVLRKAGWDTHGLPVEIEVEKKLGLDSKQAIEEYGVEKFNEECKKSTFKYEDAWVEMTRRVGFWIDMDNPYITLKNEYIQSVWWSLKQAWEKDLLYQGHKVVPYCPRCGTALSGHEVAQGYKTVTEPSIFVKFKLKGEDVFLLAWTTTPWTLISNVALAVHPDKYYVKIRFEGETLILAEERAPVLLKGKEYQLVDRFKGEELEGVEYDSLFNFVDPEKKAWYVILADFVTMGEGTGIVHIAPAFGEEDYEAGKQYDLPVVNLVHKDGTFHDEVEPWKGVFVKDADPKIIDYLEEKDLLAGTRDYTHEYPFCWRCDSPLLYYAMESWFIAMSNVKEDLIDNNNKINWYPKHLKEGRFGGFIEDVKDWALSRDRYWGTPLPIWVCSNDNCEHQVCVGSVDELRKLSESFPEEYDLHKPFVDELTVKCPQCGSLMEREPGVIDCWYDSGSAFFAQWHYPFENKDEFKDNYPVDFICEALDQTRGWFYSLLAISTFLFNKQPYRNVLTLGLVLDEKGQKMSKSKRNYVDPTTIFDKEGADALRWYLLSTNAPWNSTPFYEKVVRETLSRFMLTLWHSYRFFATYANLDSFDPDEHFVPVEQRNSLDKWMIGAFENLVVTLRDHIKNFEVHHATREVEDFVVEKLSNWYIRRSRGRLWTEEMTEDKASCYSTMYYVFLELTKLLAPFIPFLTEEIYQNLKTDERPESIHLCDYPEGNKNLIDRDLEDSMNLIRSLTEAGRTLRSQFGMKLRYPLQKAVVVCSSETEKSISRLVDLLKKEINVKEMEFSRDAEKYAERLDKEEMAQIDVDDMVLLLETVQTPELFAEGFAREIVRRIQSMRKKLDLDIEAKIKTEINVDEERKQALKDWEDYISEETRSKEIEFVDEPQGSLVKSWEISGSDVKIGIKQ